MSNKNNVSRGDLVKFIFTNGIDEWGVEGIVVGVDRFRNEKGMITDLEYDIEGSDYLDNTTRCLYKHINHKYILEILRKGGNDV